MPIYEYECVQCGKVEEAVQKVSDAPLTSCKNCSGELHKLISHSSFHLKGTGWYVTDYANNRSSCSSDAGSSKEKKDSGTDAGSLKEKKDSGTDSSPKSESTTS